MENKAKEYYTIDLSHIAKFLWAKAWLVVLAGTLCAAICFYISAFLVTPLYSSSTMLYVNNTSTSHSNPNFSISSSEITAAQSLVKTYGEILNNRTTLARVIDAANLPYTTKELSKMIKTAPSNNTEILRVTVTSDDPYEAAQIANCIADVLPVRISEIIDGASVEIVDFAVANTEKVSPNTSAHTVIGFLLGVLLAVTVLILSAMTDDTIHSEEHIIQNYEYPILAKVPDLLDTGNKRYGYYYHYRAKPKND